MRVHMGLVAALAATAVLGAGCGEDEETGGGGANDGGAQPVRVSVVLASLDNAFYVAQKEGIEAAAEDMPGVDLAVSAGRERAASSEVITLIEDAIARSPDVIAVNGSDNAPLLPALRRVIAADIPLVLFDAPAPELEGEYAAFVGTDNEAGGRAAGEWLVDELPDGGEVGMVVCVAGHPVTRARVGGFESALSPAFEVVAQSDAECDRERGRRVMEDMLTANPGLDAVFSTSDGQSAGAIEALQAAGEDPAFVSFDAQPEAVAAIQAGEVMDASAGWSARTLGAEALKAAVAAARGEPVQADTTIPVTVVDESNAADWEG